MSGISKAVIPAAGLGTRFLPFTKVVAKELLPIVGKPSIHYVVEEAVLAGIEEIIFVIARGKESIRDYFVHNHEYESKLSELGKAHYLEELNRLIDKIDVKIAYQDEPKGLGHAVLSAKEEVGDSDFLVMLPDMIIESNPSCAKQLVDAYNKTGSGIIFTDRVPKDEISAYGVLDIEDSDGKLHKLKGLVEKPSPENAPSELIVVGRYLLPAKMFQLLEETKPGHGGEIQITDALDQLAKNDGLYGLEHDAIIFDTGNKLGYLEANTYFGLKDKEFGEKYIEVIKKSV